MLSHAFGSFRQALANFRDRKATLLAFTLFFLFLTSPQAQPTSNSYNPSFPTTVTPTFNWSTYIGGSDQEFVSAMATTPTGELIVLGYTSNSNRPDNPISRAWVTRGDVTILDRTPNYSDIYLMKISAAGELFWSELLGGRDHTFLTALAIDPLGNIYVAGYTTESSLAHGGFQTVYVDKGDAFVMKLNAKGHPVWSTYLGGDRRDAATAIKVGPTGDVYVCGDTESANWTSLGTGVLRQPAGDIDGFVARLSPSGNLIWSTNLAYAGNQYALTLDVDAQGVAYVFGSSSQQVGGEGSGNFQGGASLFRINASGLPGFALNLNTPGSTIRHAVSADGNIYLTFARSLYDNPTAPYGTIQKYSSNSGELLWSRGVQGSIANLAIDPFGSVYVVGITNILAWTSAGFDTTFGGVSDNDRDAFVAKFTSAGDPVWSSYMGSDSSEGASAIAIDAANNVYIGGDTNSRYWTANGFDTVFGGGSGGNTDGFVVAVNDSLIPVTFPVTPSALGPGDSIKVRWTASDSRAGQTFQIGILPLDSPSATPIPLGSPQTAAASVISREATVNIPDWLHNGRFRMVVISKSLESAPDQRPEGRYYGTSSATITLEGFPNTAARPQWALYE